MSHTAQHGDGPGRDQDPTVDHDDRPITWEEIDRNARERPLRVRWLPVRRVRHDRDDPPVTFSPRGRR